MARKATKSQYIVMFIDDDGEPACIDGLQPRASKADADGDAKEWASECKPTTYLVAEIKILSQYTTTETVMVEPY